MYVYKFVFYFFDDILWMSNFFENRGSFMYFCIFFIIYYRVRFLINICVVNKSISK